MLRTARVREEGQRANARAAVRETLRLALEAKLDQMWPPLEPEPALRQLLADPALLAQLGRGVLTADELALLDQPAPAADDAPLDRSDLPALLYLHLLSQGLAGCVVRPHCGGRGAGRRAAVLRRAAPLYAQWLADHPGRPGAGRVLLPRRFKLGRGARGFEGLPYFFGDMRESYRSTHEIISFANRVLELLTPPGQTALLAKPFERHGPPVTLRRLETPEELAPALAAEIVGLQRRAIAISRSSPRRMTSASSWPRAERGGERRRCSSSPAAIARTRAGWWCCRCTWPRGLEFEAVLLAGADEKNYPSAEFESRLLYVAVTRALHALRIFAVGAPSALLELAGEGRYRCGAMTKGCSACRSAPSGISTTTFTSQMMLM